MPPPRPSRRRFLRESSDEEDNAYPQALLESSRGRDIESPTKRQKNIETKNSRSKPRKRGAAQRRVQATAAEGTGADAEPAGTPARTTDALHQEPSESSPQDDGYEPDLGETWETPDLSNECSSSPSEALDFFIESVSNGVVGFKHVHSKFCVVQGWDYQRQRSTVRRPQERRATHY